MKKLPRIVIDVETRSRVDLKKVGPHIYAKHPSTNCIVYGFKINNEETRLWYPLQNPKPPRDLIINLNDKKMRKVAHNAGFERAITDFTLSKLGLPPLLLEHLSCTSARARYKSYPGKLETLAPALGLKIVKDSEGHRLMLRMTKPRKPTKDDKSEWVEDEFSMARLGEYCATDVDVEALCDDILPELPEPERQLWLHELEMNRRGILVDTTLCKNILGYIKKEETELLSELFELTDGEIDTPNKVKVMQSFLSCHNIRLPNLQKKTIEDFLRDAKHISAKARRVLEIRQLSSKTSTKKYNSFIDRSDDKGILRDLWEYHGASPTGRLSGKGIQPHNFPRPLIKDTQTAIEILKLNDHEFIKLMYKNTSHLYSSVLRSMVMAPPGHDMAVFDFAAIEARILMWLVGQTNAIEAFEQGRDLYKEMAQIIFNVDHVEDIDDDQRFLGKESVLGCGYQMGPKKFKDQCFDKKGVVVTMEVAKKAVYAYRNNFPNVPDFWDKINKAAMHTCHTGKSTKYKKVIWHKRGTDLVCVLPGGREMNYPKATIKNKRTAWGEIKAQLHYWGVDSQTRKWTEFSAYGGLLTENIVQGIARDIMYYSMMNAEGKGYLTQLTVHDEIDPIYKKGKGSLDEFKKIMLTIPEWAKGMPIKGECFSTERWRK